MSLQDFIIKNDEKDLLRFLTAGSVDDGKSTLIGRLLYDSKTVYEDHLTSLKKDSAKKGSADGAIDYSLLVDGLKAEREQGITIDVAYRYFSTPKRKFIIADTPGHEQYTRNMATGASTANLLVLLIDARLGILPQTRRHSFIGSLMGIRRFVVVVNKMDLVGYSEETFSQIQKAYTDFSARLQVADIHFIPISALTGENIVERGDKMPWYQGVSLLNYLENVHIASDRNLVDMRFPIQTVIRPNQNFRGFAGTLASGILRPGDEVLSLPSMRKSRVRSISTYDGELEEAFPPQSVTVVLEDEIDLSRGDMLVHPNNQPRTLNRLEAMLVWMDANRIAENGGSYLLKHTTQTVNCDLRQIYYKVDVNTLRKQKLDDGQDHSLGLNEIGRVSIDLRRAIFADPYGSNRGTGSFILIDRLTNLTVAAGVIIDRESEDEKDLSEPKSKNIKRESSLVESSERKKVLGQEGCVVWLTGLSGSGKSSIAYALEKRLIQAGRPAYVLDGDNIRTGLAKDLGFSAKDRAENIRRVGEVAALFADAGMIVITSFISPYSIDREKARSVAPKGGFIEVFLDTPIETCEARDPKGLYKKARAGKIPGFTGIDSEYEAPTHAEISLDTANESVEKCVHRLFSVILERSRQREA